jgi:apolipoprotein N-acyltransferase
VLFLTAFIVGALSAFGFAPTGWWPLSVIALAWLIRQLVRQPRLRKGAAIGWWFGLGQFTVGLNWIATAFTFQAAMPAWLGWIAVVLLSLYLAVYPALACGVAAKLGDGDRLRTTLLLAGAWAIAEWARGVVFTGFPWNPIGVLWVGKPAAQAARLIGTYGLSALVILAAGALGLALRGQWRRVAPALALPFAAWIYGIAIPGAPPATPTRITVVQPDIGQDKRWSEAAEGERDARMAYLSQRTDPRPHLLLWPESGVTAFLEEEPAARARLAKLLGPQDLLLTGGLALVRDAQGNLTAARNSLFALGPDGRILARYDKAHLVPYGEYLPMRPQLSAIGLSRLAPGDLDFMPGPGPRSLALPGFGTVGVQVCYEIVFSGHVVDRAGRPRFIFNPSNDAWFGRWGPPQHLAQARLRAIEEGLPVVRATPTGISAVIAADGRVLASLGWHAAGRIDAALPAARSPTPFAFLGNLLAMAFALLLVALAFAVRSEDR